MSSSSSLGPRRAAIACAVSATCALLGSGRAARASTFEWTNPVNGTYSTAGNWTLTAGATAAPPVAGDIANFNELGSYTTTFTANAASDVLNVTNSTLTFVSSGGQRLYDLTTGAADLNVLSGSLTLGTAAGNGLTVNSGDMLVRGGSTMNVRFGSDVSVSTLSIANVAASNGNVFVTGSGSTLNVTGLTTMGLSGSHAWLFYQSGASGTIGLLNMAVSGVNNTRATLVVDSGSSLTSASVNMMTNAGPTGQSALLQVIGTMTLSGASTLTMGHAAADATSGARIQLLSGGTFHTGTGNINVNKEGLITNDGGQFNANGNMTITNGRYEELLGSGAAFTLAPGRTLTVQGGALFTADNATFDGNAVIVDGSGTSMQLFGTNEFASAAGTTNLTIRNNAAASLATLALGDGFNAIGNLNVQSGATVTTGSITMGTESDGSGNINLSGGSITQSGASDLTIGYTFAETSTLSITGGSFTTGTGDLTIDRNGVVHIGAAATFTPNVSTFTVDRGTFTSDVSMSAAWASTYRVEWGGDFTVNASFAISSGQFVVDGVGSTLTINSPFGPFTGPVFGISGPALLNIANGAQANITGIRLGDPLGGTGTILIESGGDAVITGLNIATFDGTGAVTVTDPGSTLTLAASSSFQIGAGVGSATVNVTNGAVVSQDASGVTHLASDGSLTIIDATVHLGALTDGGGTLNFNSGTFSYVGDLTVGVGGLLGADVGLPASKTLGLSGTTTIDANHTLQLAGGRLSTGQLVNNGTFDFQSGTLSITGAGGLTVGGAGALGASLVLGTGANVNVTNAASVEEGGSLTLAGGNFSAASLANAGTVVVNGGALAATTMDNQATGRLFVGAGAVLHMNGAIANPGRIQLQGGAAHLSGPQTLTNSGLITGDGEIAKTLTNGATGEIRAEAGKTLLLSGPAITNGGKVNLLGGTAEFSQPLTNDNLITGRGTLIAPSVANNGQITFSAGFSDVQATLTNNSGGNVFVTGGGTSTFYSPVTLSSGSEFRVSTDSTAVFLGDVTGFGAGSFTGSGTKIFEAGAINVSAIATHTGKTVVEAPASLKTGHVRESSLKVNGLVTIAPDGTAAGTSTFNTLSIADGARLELNDNDIIVDYAAGEASPEFTIRDWVLQGLTSGTGITTLATVDEDTVLAVAEQFEWAETSFNGFALDDTTVVGKYTYFGDANLDGQVTTDDYVAIDLGLGTGDSWVQGDFNLNGSVTTDDYVVVDLNLGKGTGDPLAYAEEQARMIALHTEMFGRPYVEKLAYASEHGWVAASVPEPGWGATVLGAASALMKRRRNARAGRRE